MSQTNKPKKPLWMKAHFAASKVYFRWTRGMTLGARVAVLDEQERFLLVRPTYSNRWNFPGGGVEIGETCHEAALRELREEAAIVAKADLQLHGIFSNHAIFRGDHVALYVLREFEQHPFKANGEIAEIGFFAPTALPAAASDGVAKRIREILDGERPDSHW